MPKNWKLQPKIMLEDRTAADVASIACALQSLYSYTSLACESEDTPEDLRQIVDEGLAAMRRVFVWTETTA